MHGVDLSLVLFAIASRLNAVAAQTCAAAAQTLSTSCGDNLCGLYEPCLTYNNTECPSTNSSSGIASNCTSSDEICQYACFQAFGADNSDPTKFIFLVPYDTQDEAGDGSYAAANSDVVTAIDQLTLSPQTTYVWIQGGGSYQKLNTGKVVQLELANNLLTSQSQVTSVGLVSMNLADKISSVPGMVPSTITYLSLSNSLLSEFPLHLKALSTLVTLHLNDNYIQTVNSSITWEKLTMLDLYRNNVSTFEGNFPDLTHLYLNGNNLKEIPAVIFTLQHLTKLTIKNNPLTSRTFTQAQVTFLQGLKSMDLADDDFQYGVDCSVSNQRVIGDNKVTVCVGDVPEVNDSSSASTNVEASRISYSSSSTSADTELQSKASSKDEPSALLVAVILVVIAVLAAVVGVCYMYWRYRSFQESKKANDNVPRVSSKHRAMAIWNDQELLALQVSSDDIQDIRPIGSGAFGVVWLVRYRNSRLLASKRIREDAVVTERTQAFVDEIKMVSKLDHPNIVAFIGAAWSSGSDMQALFEFVENGDLRSYLAVQSLPRFWSRAKLQLAIDVIEGLVYVHSFSPPLVHRDLKSRNVLISAEMQAKLTDFGVSRFRSTNNTMTAGIGTSRWLAPEVIVGNSDYDQSADIFSFGVLLSELDTLALPYDDAVGRQGNKLEDLAILQMVASGNLRPTFSPSCPPVILKLAERCLSQDPDERPVALKIAYTLRTVLRNVYMRE